MTKTRKREPPVWDEVAREVDEMTDGLLKPVDEAIKPIVIALIASGFETAGSCEGHGSRGTSPYVHITTAVSPPVPRNQWKTIGIRNTKLRARIERLLQEFYADRKPPTPAARLTTKAINPYGVFALRPAGLVRGRSEGTRLHQLLQFRAEFNAYAEFLKERAA